jgi:N-acetylneuraminic acid mutarotase
MARVGAKLLLFGGRVEGKERVYSNDLWQRDVGEGAMWVELSPGKKPELWPCPRHNHAVVSAGERLLVHGGARHGALKLGRYEQLYVNDFWALGDGAWRLLGEGGPKRHCHALVPVGDAEVVLFGGFGDDAYHNDVWMCDLQSQEWRAIRAKGEIPHARSQMGACMSGGHLWVFGGYYWTQKKGEVYFGDLFSFSLTDHVWMRHAVPDAPSPRNRVCMVEIAPLQMVVVNGNYYRNQRGTDEWYSDVYELSVFDDGREPLWRVVECSGRAPAQSHMACVAYDGKVYFFGGEKARRRFNTFHTLTPA